MERLGSPIHLHSEPSSLLPSASVDRPTKSASQSSRRRRLSPRRVLPYATTPHAFDDLPWRSTLDESPQLVNPWDIADLSLIECSDESPNNLGPVRRRKTSLRSTPLAPPPSKLSPTPIFPNTARDTSYLSRFLTPPPRIIPSRVLFKNLMPVSCDSDSSISCITSSSIF
ncbi:hypothetical protein BJ165DRAFT_586536 [Panaeolus papilionaceus]|nr:hypothetical protein BJ165DRAFT_586536 [Panaeolus papilionaceus]